MKICQHCQTPIQDDAEICPYCHHDVMGHWIPVGVYDDPEALQERNDRKTAGEGSFQTDVTGNGEKYPEYEPKASKMADTDLNPKKRTDASNSMLRYFRFASSTADTDGTRKRAIASAYPNTPALLEIPEKDDNGIDVIEIKKGALKNNRSLVELVIPDSVKWIRASAFENCVNLYAVRGGRKLACVEDRAFSGCIHLEECSFLKNTEADCARSAFSGCYELTLTKEKG